MSRRSFSPHQDPYNVDDEYRQQQQPQQIQTQRHYLDDVDQLAYDSMSTILEVDSEGTNSETSDRLRQFDSPLHIDTPRTPDPKTATLESSSTTNDRLSPVSDLSPKDKFSGIISALAEQMERLQPSKQSSTQQQQTTEFTSGRQSLLRPKYGGALEEDDDDPTRPPSGVSSSDSSSRRSKSSKEGQQDASTSPISSENNSQSNSPSPPESPRPGSSPGFFSGKKVSGSGQQRAGSSSNLAPKSRATSAESLMMITVSPMVSPKVRFPILRHAKQTSNQLYNDETDERKIVEVSNKSTITAIDLTLMDKMVQKYFVETKDKATQSIKFDCDDEFDTLEFNNRDGSLRRRTGARNGSRPVPVKSVAVGTEKFSRERFSLLPPTKTRSTQTKPNIDNDIGASETRRFKLAHLDLGTLRQRSQTKDSSTEFEPNIEGEQQNDEQVAENSIEEGAESQTTETKSKIRASPSPARRSKTPIEERPAINGKISPSRTPDLINRSDPKTSESSKKREQSRDSLSPNINLNVENTSTSNQDTSDNNNQQTTANNSSESSDSLQQVVLKDNGENQQIQRKIEPVPAKKNLEKVKKVDKTEISEDEDKHEQVHRSRALIPSVKTELRVIIEIQDSKQKQVSEIMSNSQLVDGKLSKKTQVNTSKHVAATPREVLNRLQTVGRESSLLYQQAQQQLREAAPGQVLRPTNPPALRWSSSPINLQNGSNDFRSARGEEPEDSRNGVGHERKNWREVSKSSVVNEIETKTRQKSGKKLDGIPDGQQESDIIMTSDALINHMSNDKSAIELRSRAAQRYENFERDPRTGEMVKTGKLSERTLVESEAGFNDEHPNGKSSEKTNDQSQKQHTAIRTTPNGRRTPVAVNNLIDNVEEQQRRLNLRSDITSPSSHQETATLSPHRQQVINEPEHRQKPEHWASQSAPNIKSLSQLDRQVPVKPATPIKRHASIEIEEESEDRQQVMENGRLVYDDRLRERKYETQRTSSPSLNVLSQDRENMQKSPLNSRPQREGQKYVTRSSSMSPRSPILSPITGGILRNREERGGYSYQQQPASQLEQTQQRSQLLKPLSLRPNGRNIADSPQAPILFADQTSNLSASSDPETMDSGFAQSGAGSSSVLNQRQAAHTVSAVSPQYHSTTSSRRPGMPVANSNSLEMNTRQAQERQQRVSRDQIRSSSNFEPHQDQLEEPISLDFVDDDVDELIDQLDNSKTNRSHVVSSGRTQVESDSYRQPSQMRQTSHMQQKPQLESKGKFSNNGNSCDLELLRDN